MLEINGEGLTIVNPESLIDELRRLYIPLSLHQQSQQYSPSFLARRVVAVLPSVAVAFGSASSLAAVHAASTVLHRSAAAWPSAPGSSLTSFSGRYEFFTLMSVWLGLFAE